MKNFLIALVIAIILANSFGSLMNDWWGMHVMIDNEYLSPWEGIAAFSALAVVFVVVGFIVAVSLAGAIAIGLFAGALGILVTGVSALWPLLLVAGIIYLVKRNRNPVAA